MTRFWESVQNLKKLPQREVPEAAQEIWTEYLSGDSLNIDSQSRELSRKNMLAPDRWAFDIAAVCNRTFSLCKIKNGDQDVINRKWPIEIS